MVSRTSGSGERNARLGLAYQDRASAVLIYHAILEGTLSFIALADDMAGMFDDLVIGIAGRVVGHQYKASRKPKAVSVVGLLLGSEQVIADCAASFISLEKQFPDKVVRLRYVSSHYPSVHDKGKFGVPAHDSADFIAEKARHPDRSLTEWRETVWRPLIAQLQAATGLDDDNFERFFTRFGSASDGCPKSSTRCGCARSDRGTQSRHRQVDHRS
jgi:hypothetical protein